ncbi:site-specific integrase [Bacillus rhizoplanae]|uniref:site-specific integrase n=1 Tax=Bacillus rhizoplanae TaxID=2880966 RepID=UPI003D1A0AA5
MTIMIQTPESPYYTELANKVDKRILHLQDARGVFILDKLGTKNIKHYVNVCLDTPWCNHLLLGMLVLGSQNLDVRTISKAFTAVNVRMKDIFQAYGLQNMSDFDVNQHVYGYLVDDVFSDHSNYMRSDFLIQYKRLSKKTLKWWKTTLSAEQSSYFQQYLFPEISFDTSEFHFHKKAREEAQSSRKNETSAVIDKLPEMRVEAAFRHEMMARLRKKFLEACKEAQKSKVTLPLPFHYDEPERVGERFYFRLWDKPSFVINHKEHFSEDTLKRARNRISTYSDENNHYFVEFMKAECHDENEIPEGLWFTEIIERGVLGLWYQNKSDKEIAQKKELLQSWGYVEEGSTANAVPFYSNQKGILTQNVFVSIHRSKAEGVLFDVEPLYATATFGFLAVDILTRTGARINELMQISYTKNCLTATNLEGATRYMFYAVPKGRDVPEPYYLSESTMMHINSVREYLMEHYGGKIPSVLYRGNRSHIFKKPQPYMFQYHGKAMDHIGISACMRFLLHGMIFQTENGQSIKIKSHLLRHAFATEAAQRLGVPIDILAIFLHQKNIDVTKYYSKPTNKMVSEAVADMHLGYFDLDEEILRSPQELQEKLAEYKGDFGVLNNVLGGTCVVNTTCPHQMACIGCASKVPDPAKKHQLEDVVALLDENIKKYEKMGLPLEVRKAKENKRKVRLELKEIKAMECYMEELKHDPKITFGR